MHKAFSDKLKCKNTKKAIRWFYILLINSDFDEITDSCSSLRVRKGKLSAKG